MKKINCLLAFGLLIASPLFASTKNNSTATPTATAYDSDYLAIDQLIVAERLYRVTHRDKELADCYAPDAKIRTSWQNGDVKSFIGKRPADAANALPNVNRNSGALIHRNGSRAFVEYPSTTTRGVMIHGQEAVLTSYMRLLYLVEKRGNDWKIVSMTSVNEYDELKPAIPNTDLQIDPKDLAGLRISYRWLAYSRKQAGGTVSNDEFGTDRPEAVEKLYQESWQWLNQAH